MHVKIAKKKTASKAHVITNLQSLMQEVTFLRAEVSRLRRICETSSHPEVPSPPRELHVKVHPKVDKDLHMPPALSTVRSFGMLPDVNLLGLGTGQLIKLSELVAARVAVLDFWTTK
jgi:hypothetical protein